jgi:hypothetical protein
MSAVREGVLPVQRSYVVRNDGRVSGSGSWGMSMEERDAEIVVSIIVTGLAIY